MIKTEVINVENKNFFEIVCGVCGEKMIVEDTELKCPKGCMCVNKDYLNNFLDEKYRDKITKIEVTNKNSAKIYLGK